MVHFWDIMITFLSLFIRYFLTATLERHTGQWKWQRKAQFCTKQDFKQLVGYKKPSEMCVWAFPSSHTHILENVTVQYSQLCSGICLPLSNVKGNIFMLSIPLLTSIRFDVSVRKRPDDCSRSSFSELASGGASRHTCSCWTRPLDAHWYSVIRSGCVSSPSLERHELGLRFSYIKGKGCFVLKHTCSEEDEQLCLCELHFLWDLFSSVLLQFSH